MSGSRILAIARRIAQGFRRDERTLGLMFVVPLVVTALLGWVLREQKDSVVDVVIVNDAGPSAIASWPRSSRLPRTRTTRSQWPPR